MSSQDPPHHPPAHHDPPVMSTVEAFADRKRVVEAKFGPGAWQKIEKVRPHRCNGHIEDFMVASTTIPFTDAGRTFKLIFSCFWSQPGHEPTRIYKQPTPYGGQSGLKRGMWWNDDRTTDEEKDIAAKAAS
ncbi:uncharacterized protein EV422DRAFT_503938 [Fimicolochytrium jonesii]|uniref:uncharacterized protein n=1 Tax=Fimicolochytrium jonesii TaxID=1396493 RepID=UPI0022FE9AB2|nr:uncharacterized protein EV422DRAFT_503938 [Fimicolochytrium jonesii]KAI8825191.1 hypothetical protein EV422DRAFT_503938 [Fimicolochytrium jonesii]